jgi:cytochrome b561
MAKDTAPKRYHPFHVILHWLVASLTFFLLYLGLFVFPNTPNSQEAPLLGLHKTAGILLGLIVIVRLVTRYVFKRPEPADAGNPILNFGSRAIHFLLYVGIFTMMFTGDSLDRAYGLTGILAGNGNKIPDDLFVYPQRLVHGYLGYVMVALVTLHISAAFYHQFIRRDNLISRMWFGK